MKRYATLENYNVDYDEVIEKFFITSKEDNLAQIGGFDKAAEAIDYAEKLIVKNGSSLCDN